MKSYKSILIIVASLMVLLWASCDIDHVSDCCDDSNQDERVTVNEVYKVTVNHQTAFSLSNLNGNLSIKGTDSDSVVIRVRRIVGSYSTEDAEYYMTKFYVRITEGTTVIDCETVYPSNASNRSFEAHYEIELPKAMAVQSSLLNGSTSIEEIHGAVTVSSTNGSVDLTDIRGEVNGSLVNGQINAHVILPDRGRCVLSTVNGNAQLVIPSTTEASFKAQTVNGSVNVSGFLLDNLSSSNTSVTGVLNGGGGSVVVSTVNGNVTVSGN